MGRFKKAVSHYSPQAEEEEEEDVSQPPLSQWHEEEYSDPPTTTNKNKPTTLSSNTAAGAESGLNLGAIALTNMVNLNYFYEVSSSSSSDIEVSSAAVANSSNNNENGNESQYSHRPPAEVVYSTTEGGEKEGATTTTTKEYRRLLLVSNLFFLLGCILYLVVAVDGLKWAKQVQYEQIPDSVLYADDDATWIDFRLQQQQQQQQDGKTNNGEGSRQLATYDDYDWEDLPVTIQMLAQVLGYDSNSWDNALPVYTAEMEWSQLTVGQQVAAQALGYDEALWNAWGDGTDGTDFNTANTDTDSTNGRAGDSNPGDTTSTTETSVAPSITAEGDLPEPQTHISYTTGTNTANATTTNEWESYYDLGWQDLPDAVQQAYSTLGYDQELWDNGMAVSTDELTWEQLSTQQQQAAIFLGHSQPIWDGGGTPEPDTPHDLTPFSSPTATLEWYDFDWSDLPTDIQASFVILGYSEDSWDAGESVSSENLSWDELTLSEQTAALSVGYTQELWDGPGLSLPSATPEESEFASKSTPTANTASSPDPAAQWYNSYWADLPPEIQDAFTSLGYTQPIWDNDQAAPPTYEMGWTELTPQQQEAADALGYDQSLWGNDEPPSSITASVDTFINEDDDYVFLVPSRDVWVSRYMILYFSAALCFVFVGLLDWCREHKWFHVFMILAGLCGLVSAMVVEKNRMASVACNLVSVHFFFLEGLNIVWGRIQSRIQSKSSSSTENAASEGEENNKRSTSTIMSGSLWISPVQMTADSFFVIGALLDVVLSYFSLFDRSSDWSLSLAQVNGFSTLLWVFAGIMYLVVTMVLYYGWFLCFIGGDKVFRDNRSSRTCY